MNLVELLPPDFSVRDSLDPSTAEQLATACQRLDVPVPPPDETPGSSPTQRLVRARAERQQLLNEALDMAVSLVQSSAYDIQALAVLMRLSIEANGLEGCEQALAVLSQMLNRGWSDLAAASAQQPEREREKLQRRWGRYLDAVFEQLYLWLAREHERDAQALGQTLQQSAERWQALRLDVERGLGGAGARVSRFEAASQLLENLCRAPRLAEPAQVVERAGSGGAPMPSTRVAAAITATSDAQPDPGAGGTPVRALLEVSGRFWELQQRLAAFAELLERREYEKAGIVEADLRKTLERFDVASYFPGLFAQYFGACAEHARQLAEHRPDEGAMRSSSLASLYRTDLRTFLQFPARAGAD